MDKLNPGAAYNNSSDLQILIVDDDQLITNLLEKFLRMQDFSKIRVSNDPSDAMAFMSSQRVDVFISDMHMPGCTGLELMKTAKRMGIRIRILMSANLTPEIRQQAERVGIVVLDKYSSFERLGLLIKDRDLPPRSAC